MPTPRRGLLVMNPIAGAPGSTVGEAVRARCEAALEHLDVVRTAEAGHAVRLVAEAVAADSALDLVVVAGGDGTACEAAEGLARGLGRWPDGGGDAEQPALCLLPAGSGNSAYHHLCPDRGSEEMLDLALGDGAGTRVRQIDLVRVADGDRASLLGVNAGLFAHIAAQLERRKHEDRVRGASSDDPPGDDEQRYWAAFAAALEGFRPFPVSVTVDDRAIYDGTAMIVTVGGVGSFGRGNFRLLPRSLMDDGLLDVCVVAEVDVGVLTELAGLARTGAHLERPEVAYAQGERVTVRRSDGEPLAVEHDGDPRAAGDVVELRAVRGAVPVVVPA